MKFIYLFIFSLVPVLGQITYQGGDGPGKGKHIVFVASDHALGL